MNMKEICQLHKQKYNTNKNSLASLIVFADAEFQTIFIRSCHHNQHSRALFFTLLEKNEYPTPIYDDMYRCI